MTDRTRRAYEVTGEALRARLRGERPVDAKLLDETLRGEVVEVLGAYDHIGDVLRATGVPFARVMPEQLESLDWNLAKTVLVNCPGQIPQEAIAILREWVRAGGTLITTDWALKHTVEPAFPGLVRHNGAQTPDCVVKVQTVGDDPLLSGFLEDGREPLWWLEGASYPIEVLDRERVRVLLASDEVGSRWGAPAVVVRWDEGKGEVLHLLSHLYLQRAETRCTRDRASAAAFFVESGYRGEMLLRLAGQAGDLNAAELKRAYTSASFAAEAILRAKKRKG